MLHFACHGYLNSKQVMQSGLVMAPEPTDSSDTGVLTASEIMETPLAAQLAVLSACQTGQGIQSGGEGLMGLAWAFRAAGCSAVVASKWEVDDEATRHVMVRFYKELLKGARKDDALRTSMLAEMKAKEKAEPTRATVATSHAGPRSNAHYWAAFQLIGDPSPLTPLPGH